jgi:hypothetical protein
LTGRDGPPCDGIGHRPPGIGVCVPARLSEARGPCRSPSAWRYRPYTRPASRGRRLEDWWAYPWARALISTPV